MAEVACEIQTFFLSSRNRNAQKRKRSRGLPSDQIAALNFWDVEVS
jgi:hypothetical protein